MISECFGDRWVVDILGSHKYGIATVFSDVDVMIREREGMSPSRREEHHGWQSKFQEYLKTWSSPTDAIENVKVAAGQVAVVR